MPHTKQNTKSLNTWGGTKQGGTMPAKTKHELITHTEDQNLTLESRQSTGEFLWHSTIEDRIIWHGSRVRTRLKREIWLRENWRQVCHQQQLRGISTTTPPVSHTPRKTEQKNNHTNRNKTHWIPDPDRTVCKNGCNFSIVNAPFYVKLLELILLELNQRQNYSDSATVHNCIQIIVLLR